MSAHGILEFFVIRNICCMKALNHDGEWSWGISHCLIEDQRPDEDREEPCVEVVPYGLADLRGDDPSMKIEYLDTAKIMTIKWLILGCLEANFCKTKYSLENSWRDLKDLHVRLWGEKNRNWTWDNENVSSIYTKEANNEGNIYIPLHLSDLNNSTNFRHEFYKESEVNR